MEQAKKDNEELLIEQMKHKSQQSFLLAIELYNKPTIELRTEGFCFFICNAWELMLKAYLLSQNHRINYRDKKANKNRTISLSECLNKVLTNKKDPVKINLETIIGIRNTAFHLIIPEYTLLMSNVFLSCVKNYVAKFKTYFDINVTTLLPDGMLNLSIPSRIDYVQLLEKYGKSIANSLKSKNNYLDKVYSSVSKDGLVPEAFAISMQYTSVSITDKSEADVKTCKVGKSDADTKVIYKATDPSVTHPYSRGTIMEKVNEEIISKKLVFNKVSLTASEKFNSYTFDLFSNYFKIKEIPEYTYAHKSSAGKSTKTTSYTYSLQLIQKIINEITDNPDIFVLIKQKMHKKS